MSLSIEILNPSRDPQPPDWPAFLAAHGLHPPWSYDLLAIEAADERQPSVLVLVRDGGVLVAALSALIARRGRGPRWVEIFQQWMSGEPGWVFAGHLDPVACKEIFRKVERALCRHVGLTCLGLVYWYLRPADIELIGGFGRYVRQGVGVAMLDNTFATPDDWLATLSRNRRKSLRKLHRELSGDPSLEIRFAAARTDLDGGEVVNLLHRHRAKFGRLRYDSRNPVTAEYLTALLSRPDVHTLTYHRNGTLVGFTNVLDHPTHLLNQHFAMVPVEAGGVPHLYFDVYPRMVEHMIDRGRSSLSVGRGMIETKVSLGFEIEPRWVAVVPRIVAG